MQTAQNYPGDTKKVKLLSGSSYYDSQKFQNHSKPDLVTKIFGTTLIIIL